MKRKGMHRRRKWVLLAVLLIMVGIAVWRIWQTPRPVVLHRQDAWLSSAEPEMVDTLPDNTFTAELPEEIDGRLLYIRDYSASGHLPDCMGGCISGGGGSVPDCPAGQGFHAPDGDGGGYRQRRFACARRLDAEYLPVRRDAEHADDAR